MEYVSTGFMAITRKVLEQVRDKLELTLLHPDSETGQCYPFFEAGRDLKHMFFLSEEWNFCDKAREAGFKIYWHTGVLLGHLKRVILRPKGE